jgi:HEAT repeat protein
VASARVALAVAFALGFLQASARNEAELLAAIEKNQDATAALELAQRGESAVPLLVRGLEQGKRTAALCAWALVRHPRPGTDAALRLRLLEVDQVAGYYAARALGKLPSPENVAALSALLASETNGYWELSSGGVGRLRDAWNDKGQRYHEPAPANMPNLRVAYAAMEALGALGGTQAAATLRRALDSDQYLIRFGAARGLARLQDRTAEARLASMSENDPVLLVRRAADEALSAIRGQSPVPPPAKPALPPSIAFIKTKHRSDATLGFRDSYFFPKTPRYHSGENLYTLTPPRPDGVLRNLTQVSDGEVQGPEVSFDGQRLLFAMRRDKAHDGFHIFEIRADGSGLRQLTEGNCNDVDPCYLPDGRIAFCSDRCGWQEYYHQERSRVLHVMNADGGGLHAITFNPNQDYEPFVLSDGRISYSSYRFYAQDGSEGPLPGEWMGLARIETVLRACNPDGSADQLLYGSMRGSFYVPMRPMPFADQFAGWHRRGYHVGVSVSQQKEMPDGKILCTTPAGLTLVDPRLTPLDCEMPVYPEVVNLAGGEEVYIHNYDDMNPVGRYTTPYPAGDGWAWVSHAPWHDLRVNGYGLYLMNLATRELESIYDDPRMSDVDPVPLAPSRALAARESTLKPPAPERPGPTGRILCNSVLNTDVPFDTDAVRYVRVLEGVQMGQSIAANAAFRTRILGTTPVHADGSFYVEVPADVPLRFELLDENGRMLVHETEFNSVRAGETKGCIGCHENRRTSTPNRRPLALGQPPVSIRRNRGDLVYMGQKSRPYNRVYRE